MRSFVTYTFSQMLYEESNRGQSEGRNVWLLWERRRNKQKTLVWTLKERGQLENLGIDGRITLNES
jgi:hypothetical protein